ncbi:hypothetical protein AB4084_14555, partial [Lysobacter sp. 2RAB21]
MLEKPDRVVSALSLRVRHNAAVAELSGARAILRNALVVPLDFRAVRNRRERGEPRAAIESRPWLQCADPAWVSGKATGFTRNAHTTPAINKAMPIRVS